MAAQKSLALFVTGTGTDVGKTYVGAALLRAAKAQGLTVAATKPVMSGVDDAKPAESDAGQLLAATGITPTAKGVEKISPWRFAAPFAPTAAARKEGRPLPYDEVVNFCRERLGNRVGLHIVEGAGGVMSPIAEEALALDLIEDLELPALLVGGDHLGAVSHILTAIEALGSRRIEVLGVVINEPTKGGVGAPAIVDELAAFLETDILFPWRHDRADPPPGLMKALGLSG